MAFPCVTTGSVATTGKYFVVAFEVIRHRMYQRLRFDRMGSARWLALDGWTRLEIGARIDNAARRVARRRYYRQHGSN